MSHRKRAEAACSADKGRVNESRSLSTQNEYIPYQSENNPSAITEGQALIQNKYIAILSFITGFNNEKNRKVRFALTGILFFLVFAMGLLRPQQKPERKCYLIRQILLSFTLSEIESVETTFSAFVRDGRILWILPSISRFMLSNAGALEPLRLDGST